MQPQIFPTYKALSRATANLIGQYIAGHPSSLICLASGHTPLGVFECLLDDVNKGHLDISKCTFIGLDEWLGMNGTDQGSCRQMMDEFLFTPLRIPASRIHFFDGKSKDPQQEVNRINDLIQAHGGLDIMLVGIGTNGHIAMNEPGSSFEERAHISQLADETIRVGQKYFQTATPLEKGITLGLKNLSESRLPILMASGPSKKSIISRVMQEEVSERLPATLIKAIPHAHLMLDADCAP